MDSNEIQGRIKAAQINNALGVFMLAFGVVVLFAMLYTETMVQHLTDLVAGLVLISIGGGMMWKAKRTIKRLKSDLE
jgi:multisubunit Na+/H+ antiporter MnhG subunit